MVCNTACGSGCSNGLTNTCISFSLTKIPFSKKLCDSGFFDGPSSTMKYLIEALNFCDGNGLACALSCCLASEMTCNRQRAACYQVSPGFNCKVDITSQYTAGTAAQYTWGKCFCSATRWFIGDTDCVTVRFCNCNTLCGGEITWQCLLCGQHIHMNRPLEGQVIVGVVVHNSELKCIFALGLCI